MFAVRGVISDDYFLVVCSNPAAEILWSLSTSGSELPTKQEKLLNISDNQNLQSTTIHSENLTQIIEINDRTERQSDGFPELHRNVPFEMMISDPNFQWTRTIPWNFMLPSLETTTRCM